MTFTCATPEELLPAFGSTSSSLSRFLVFGILLSSLCEFVGVGVLGDMAMRSFLPRGFVRTGCGVQGQR